MTDKIPNMKWQSAVTESDESKSQTLTEVDHFPFDFTRYTIKAPTYEPKEPEVE